VKCIKCGYKNKTLKNSLTCKYCGADLIPAGDDKNFKTYSFKDDPAIIADLDRIGKILSASRKGKVTRSKLIRLAVRRLAKELQS
jgi:hypothetical protein